MSMKYDFTTILNREGTGAIAVSKIPFDNAEIKEGFSKIPMWVADMNYATAPSVIEAIQNRLAHPVLEERILKDGIVKPGNVLKVDSFLNHQMDIAFINELGKEFQRRFADAPITKILTIEASGIGIACIAAQYFHVPVVFAKKAQSVNLDGEMYTTKVESFTHKKVYDVILSKKFLGPEDHVLLIDDFLANGCALLGLIDIVKKSGATLEGAGIVIEKGFQSGGQTIRDMGIHLESLAIIDSIADGKLTFRE